MVVAVAAWSGASTSLVLAVIALLAATVAYARSDRRPPSSRQPESPMVQRRTPLFRRASFAILVASAAPFGIAIGALDVGVQAFAAESGQSGAAGAGLAALALGIALGSVAFGSRQPRIDPVTGYAICCVLTSIFLLALAFAGSSSTLIGALLLTGLGLGPLTAYEFLLLDRAAPAAQATEAVAWLTSVGFVGAAIGTAGAGVLIEELGIRAALLLGGVATSASGPLIWGLRSKLAERSDERKADASTASRSDALAPF